MSEVVVPRDTIVLAHFQASNSNKALWGDDAQEWKPERWLAPLPGLLEDAHLPGVYANLSVSGLISSLRGRGTYTDSAFVH